MELISALGQKHAFMFSLPSFTVSKVSCLPLTSFRGKHAKLFRLKATNTLSCDDQESNRKFKKLPTSEWTHHFHSLSIDVSEMDALREQVDALKRKVKRRLMPSQGIDSTKKSVLMIYLLVSLGLAYHFEDEIYETLIEGFQKIEEIMSGEEDLYTVSIIFWVFRRYGHHVSSDVFRRFKDGSDGNFKETLIDDVKGMLSFYEAAHLRTTKDYVLDEALSFTSNHLESFATSGMCPPHLSIRIQNALTISQHANMEMLVAVEYISFYEQEKDHDEMLLKFAKLSFNLLQLQYRQELKTLTKWYKEIDFASNLPPYFRDRIAENHYFAQASFFEPHRSRARVMLTKHFTALTLHDDTYDRYASLSEAESLANSLIRWAPHPDIEKQPDYLKFVLNFILDIFEDFERELRPEGRSDNVKAAIEEFKIIAKANLALAKWALVGHLPSFEEYMEVGAVEIALCAALAGIFMSMGKMVTNEAFEWLKSRPKFIKSLFFKVRLMNDITGFEDDMSRGYITNAVNCYMKQYGVTKEETLRELYKMVEEGDKIINEEFLTTTCVPYCVLKGTLDLVRMTNVSYLGSEAYTHPEGRTKEFMTCLYLHQFPL